MPLEKPHPESFLDPVQAAQNRRWMNSDGRAGGGKRPTLSDGAYVAQIVPVHSHCKFAILK
jgi:hypothetical protein